MSAYSGEMIATTTTTTTSTGSTTTAYGSAR